ncbi:MAG TPA: TlpA disulfide reductase family protein [Fibrobacteria bacterium]|nr:TlpA disulfide reductase family protein [Fibrobacteria bacterium]
MKPFAASILGILLLFGCRIPGIHLRPSPENLLNHPFPSFAFASIPGRDSVRSTDLLGSPSIVVFWATWCAPCREEVGTLERVLKEEGPSGLKIIGLSVDDSPAAVPLLVDRLQIPYPVGVGANGFFYDLKLEEIPQVYVLDGKGIVRGSFTGGAEEPALLQAIADARKPG